MADGSVTLNLDDATLARLEGAARCLGVSPHDYAEAVLANALSNWDAAEDLRRLAEDDRTGESVSVEEAFAHLRREIAERRARRA